MSESDKDTGYFYFELPVYKKGDDFASCLENSSSTAEAFKLLADTYAEASRRCRRMAGVVLENPGFTADGDTHIISVEAPKSVAAPLVEEGLLYVDEYMEEFLAEEGGDFEDSDEDDEVTDPEIDGQMLVKIADLDAELQLKSNLCSLDPNWSSCNKK